MQPPSVSVICPSYGHAEFLSQAIESVISQTFSDWELIVIDDQSPDDSVDVLGTLAARDPRIRILINPENLGTYGTLERARKIARGQFIAVLNSDDVWLPEKLEVQVAWLEQHPSANFCFALGERIDRNGNVLPGDPLHGNWPVETEPHVLPHLLSENRILASSVLFRARGLSFHGPMRYSGDWLVLLRAGKGVGVPKILSYWRIHDHNSFVRSPRQVREEIQVRLAIAQAWEAGDRTPAERFRLAHNRMHLAALKVLCGDPRAAIAHAWRAVAIWRDRVTVRRLLRVLMPNAREKLWPGENPISTQTHADPPSVEGILDYLRSA